MRCLEATDSKNVLESVAFGVFGDSGFNQVLAVGTGFHVPGWDFLSVVKRSFRDFGLDREDAGLPAFTQAWDRFKQQH